ncbi:hypothetical protein HPB49_004654 [Dermacentor silvarum]|uniref:Uncharacterized protein n=1 Tax=Dermacentor silvarum TaxID=543639 RepID=A0ACB8DUJ0_DERSI|nr:hypothetical protein HPB49_004654 [Dermacentor silvarum]
MEKPSSDAPYTRKKSTYASDAADWATEWTSAPTPKTKQAPKRGCGARNPNQEHQYTPRGDLCGEAHPAADKTCKARFKTRYIMKRRRWERWMQAKEQATMEAAATVPTGPSRSRSRSRGQSSSRGRSRSRGRSESRGRSRSRGRTRSRTSGKRRGNSKSRSWPANATEKLTKEVQDLKKEHRQPLEWPVNAPVAELPEVDHQPAAKKRAVHPQQESSRVAHDRSEVKDMFTEIQKTVSSIPTAVAGLTDRVIRIEEVVGVTPAPQGQLG